MRLNLNETIKVKLTDLGKDIYYHKYDRINAFFGRELCKPSYPKVDDDGYTEFQLWCFIELYGEHIGMARQNVICPIEIVFDAPEVVSEIIMCKDCEYHRQNYAGDSWCGHPKGLDGFELMPTDFCSAAERRTNERKTE